MKCDNLKAFNCVEIDVQDFCEPRLVYSKSDVDAAIAELNERDRKTQRALWLARHERAMAESYSVLNDVPTSNRWIKALNKLNAKAEEYR